MPSITSHKRGIHRDTLCCDCSLSMVLKCLSLLCTRFHDKARTQQPKNRANRNQANTHKSYADNKVVRWEIRK